MNGEKRANFNSPNNEINNANRGTEIASKTVREKNDGKKVIRNGILTRIIHIIRRVRSFIHGDDDAKGAFK